MMRTRLRERGGDLLVLGGLLAACLWLATLQPSVWSWSRDAARWWTAAGALAFYVGAIGLGAARRRRRTRAQHRPLGADVCIVWFASQTGVAEALAERSAERLRAAGIDAQARPLAQFDPARVPAGARALFVASTTGEGDAPDCVARFVRDGMARVTSLAGLRYGVLALGDREYAQFCAFGHRLDAWLRQQGAEPLFDLVEVDDGDDGALRHWQHHLDQLSGRVDLPDWEAPSYRPWRLHARRLLNPGSAGGAAFHLELVPETQMELQWEAGDIAEIGPRLAPSVVDAFLHASGWDPHALIELDGARIALRDALATRQPPAQAATRDADAAALVATLPRLPHREYSIASVPQDGALHLLVRQLHRPDGSLGLGAGWLTEYAQIGAAIDLRLRRNPGFHAPRDERPMILIGNGSGIAGLRALLKQRAARGHGRNWLLFGERNAARDAFYGDEIEAWRRSGIIARVDHAWSRDGQERTYVQQRLREAAAEVRRWVDDGASIYVCGSLQGMAPGVDAVLREILGAPVLEVLLESGRYRRDVY
jgi:sulfite reductase (NADPH) flavoprotein alpha-component